MTRQILWTTALILLVCFWTPYAQAQQKTGYVDVDYIIAKIPQSNTVNASLKEYSDQLEAAVKSKQALYETKLAEYQQSAPTLLPAVLQAREDELRNLIADIQNSQTQAHSLLKNHQSKLMQPLYEAIGDAIEIVAEENGYDFVFNRNIDGVDVLVYGAEQHDLTQQVIAKVSASSP